jgi:hypothetical protein
VVIVDDQPEVTMEEERFTFDADNGFQEVRSKKNVKEARQKGVVEEQKVARASREQKDRERGERDRERKGKSSGPGAMPPVAVPPGPGTGVAGPPVGSIAPGPAAVKVPFERPRQNKLPPRFAKQRENNRLQKAVQQHQHHVSVHNDVSEMNKINHSVSLFPVKGEELTESLRMLCFSVWAEIVCHFMLYCIAEDLSHAVKNLDTVKPG